MNKISFFMVFYFSLISLSCGKDKPADSAGLLGMYFQFKAKSTAIKLPKRLTEISGLAVSPDGKLFAHNDEAGVIYQLDYSSSKILKQFSLGKKTIREEYILKL